jgi:probable HAF family extracellular repeat protein
MISAKMKALFGISIALSAVAFASKAYGPPPPPPLFDPGDLGGQTCGGSVVNNGGTVAGVCRNSTGNFVAFRKPPDPATIVALPTLVANKPCSVQDMNNNDAISGNCQLASGQSVPVRWQAGSPPSAPQQLQPALGDNDAVAGQINQSGAIVGESLNSNGRGQVVVWPGGSTTATVLPLPGLLGLGTIGCSAADLNDNTSPGPVVAGTCNFTDGRTRAYRWTPTGLLGAYVATELSPTPGGTNCIAKDINANQQVTGACLNASDRATAVRWPDSSATPVTADAVAPANSQSGAVAINSQGLIAGNYVNSDGDRRCFFWNPNNGNFVDLGLLPGGTWCKAADINGQNNTIVGTAETGTGAVHAYIWRLSTGMIDLGTYGGFSSAARDVSDNSRVVGTAKNSPGKSRAFYTDPFN